MSSNSESESSEEEVNLPNIIKSSDFGHEQRLAHGESTQDSELQQLMQSVTKIVANLYKLSTIIRRGNLGHDRLLKSSKINVSYYEPFDIEHARNKFPSANDKLIYRMGQAISRRRQYLKYREQHHDKLSEPTIVPLTRQPVINTQTASKSDLGAHYKAQSHHNSQEQESTAQPVSVGVSTTASTFVLPKTPGPIDLDVDVYSESGTVSSYQSSAAGEEKLQFPPPPEASKDGQDFECPFCYTICRLNGKEEWQRKREWKYASSAIQLKFGAQFSTGDICSKISSLICAPSTTATNWRPCLRGDRIGLGTKLKCIEKSGAVIPLDTKRSRTGASS